MEAEREAMKRLDFLVGKWSGRALVLRGPGEAIELRQSEEVHYKLDGLVLLVEGAGCNAEGQIVFQALAIISYDDTASTYRFRAYSDGHYLDTELIVRPRGFGWGYTFGPVMVNNTMQLDDNNDWVEVTETIIESSPPRQSVQMKLHQLESYID